MDKLRDRVAIVAGGARTAIAEAPTYDRILHALAAIKADVATVDNTAGRARSRPSAGAHGGQPKPKLFYREDGPDA